MIRLRNLLCSGCLLVGLLLCWPVRAHAAPTVKPTFAKDVAPLVTRYCGKCHGPTKPKGGVALTAFADDASVLKKRAVWEQVADNLRAGDMPPPGKPQPSAAELDTINAWLDAVVFQMDCNGKKDPGRVTIRRLNRAEYNNTIRDLVGIDFQPANDFPQDDVGYGFDNIGDVLSLPPLLMEKYLAAAEKITEKALASPEARKRLFPVMTQNEESAKQILERFATRAYRRPLRRDELRRLMRFVEMAEKNRDRFDTGISLAIQAVLVSPHFLFRVEMDRRPDDPKAIHAISHYELASRLSYFLWSSMPDDQLFALAAKKALHQNLETQVKRMLQDPRAQALVDNFAMQWLQLRTLRNFTPDAKLFPSFDDSLRTAMVKETELFLQAIIREDRSILDLIDGPFTYLNERLAQHYGIADTNGNSRNGKATKPRGEQIPREQFVRVALQGGERGGILGQASVLAVTSNPTRTSPVKRGRWVLEQILGTPPPPPPPDVPDLPEGEKAELKGSLRQRMEQHRSNPSCANCHARLDPLGFAFENYDAIGRFRTKDGNFPIDPSGELPGGVKFQGAGELKQILKGKKDLFSRCLTEKLLTYGLGRGLEYYDKAPVDRILQALEKKDYRFSALVIEIVKSDPFRMRRGKEEVK
jgi:hypothetical protein